MELTIPKPLKAEHDELHAELAAATKAPGAVGEAAQAVARLLHPHFLKEEAFALPPLGLLAALADAPPAPGMERVLQMTNRLKSELPTMLAEHKAIVAALDQLVQAARAAGDRHTEQFAHKLMLHARTEEEVMYPAALLVGELIRRQATA